MRILFVAPRYHTNQTTIVKTLLEKGHEVHFHAVYRGFTEDHSLVEPVIVPESRLSVVIRRLFGDDGVQQRGYLPKPYLYWRLFKQFQPDLIIIRAHFRIFTWLVAFYARLTGCRVVFYEQRTIENLRQLFHWRGIRPAARKLRFELRNIFFDAAWMTPLSSDQTDREPLPARCYYVPFAVPVKSIRRERSTHPRILVVGKFERRKNHLLMVQAAARLAKRYEFDVTCVGEAATEKRRAYRQEVVDEIRKAELDDVVRLKSDVPFNKMEDIYRAHDIFVLPASNEPASIAVLEAMALGMPVVCSDTCGTRTYIEDGVNGYVFESGNRRALEQVLERFLVEPGLHERMGQRAAEYATRHMSPDAYYRRFTGMLEAQFGMSA